MGYSARYHAASLAAVFLALAIGILIGAQWGSDVLNSTREDLDNPNIVKVALARNGDALYFSRSVIPYARHPRVAPPLRHLGIYAYRRDFLENYVRWAPTPLEQTESLEQLRALENGARIRVILTDHVSVGVDTPEQAEQVEQILLNIH